MNSVDRERVKSYEDAVGENLRSIRSRRGLTQEGLAVKCGLSSQHISKIERRVIVPSVASLAKLAVALDVDPAEFFKVI